MERVHVREEASARASYKRKNQRERQRAKMKGEAPRPRKKTKMKGEYLYISPKWSPEYLMREKCCYVILKAGNTGRFAPFANVEKNMHNSV